LSQRQEIQAGAFVSDTQTLVQNAAPQATVSPVQVTHSSDSPGGDASIVACCVQSATQSAAAWIVSAGQFGKQLSTAADVAPQPGSTGTELAAPKMQSLPISDAASGPVKVFPAPLMYSRLA
jgi:hypothetical protein